MQTYTLCLEKMCIPARLGVFPAEIAMPQTIELDLRLEVNAGACDFDHAEGVPCYASLAADIMRLVLEEHTPLCEQLAQKIAQYCFRDSRIIACHLKIIKPHAVAQANAGVSIQFHRDECSHD